MINSTLLSNVTAKVSYTGYKSINNSDKLQKSSSGSAYSADFTADLISTRKQADAASESSQSQTASQYGGGDVLELSSRISAASDFKVDVDSLVEQNNQRMQDFTSKLMSMAVSKGQTANADIFGMKLEVTQQDIDDARASISEGGEWSVNAVADRIMNMAYALSGGDESKVSSLKDAVLEGFSQAGFDPDNRSSMPDITGDTYDEILSRFDDWEENGMKTYGLDSDTSTGSSTSSVSASSASDTEVMSSLRIRYSSAQYSMASAYSSGGMIDLEA